MALPYAQKQRRWLVLIISVLALYWLQPASPIHGLSFWLPTASLVMLILSWAITRQSSHSRFDLVAAGIIAIFVLGLGLTRHVPTLCYLTAARPPQTWQVTLVLISVGLLALIIFRFNIRQSYIPWSAAGLVLLLFCVLKSPTLSLMASSLLRKLSGQDPSLAAASDISWLGFSYIAFRLLHILRDRITGRLPEVSLDEFISYIIFFPALTAGPIDRIEHFVGQMRERLALNSNTFLSAGVRIISGMFMKFVLADGLMLLSLNPENSLLVTSTSWMWLLTYAYAFRILFDFAGYTSIAIGIGMLFGIRLPENFAQPYRQSNLTSFWNSWHITLAQWFRAYFFNPLSRFMRQKKLPAWTIIFSAQVSTMVLIGLWHGISWNFFLWGLWHGLGLFIHNRWAEFCKGRSPLLPHKLGKVFSIILTFHFVVLGWVWFALPSPAHSLHVYRVLFGGGK